MPPKWEELRTQIKREMNLFTTEEEEKDYFDGRHIRGINILVGAKEVLEINLWGIVKRFKLRDGFIDFQTITQKMQSWVFCMV